MPGYILNAPEAVYGQGAASGYRDTGINADNLTSRQEVLQRKPLRRSSAAPLLAGRRIIDKGGEGDMPIDVGTNGLGMYLKAAASTASSTLLSGATTAHRQLFGWTAAGPPIGTAGGSIVSEKYVAREDGVTFDPFSYKGGKVTKWKLGQDIDGFLVLTLSMDYLSSTLLESDPGRTPIEPDVAFQYAWPDALITLTPKDEDDGDPETECLKSFEVEGDNAVDVDAWCLKRGTGRHEPSRFKTPEHTGTLTWKYQHPRYFTAFKNGTAFSVTANWKAPQKIETITMVDVFPELTITLGTIVFQEPNDPQAQVDAVTEQTLPFVVLDDASGDPVIAWDQVTSDTAL